jgi:hypothetical protein
LIRVNGRCDRGWSSLFRVSCSWFGVVAGGVIAVGVNGIVCGSCVIVVGSCVIVIGVVVIVICVVDIVIGT